MRRSNVVVMQPQKSGRFGDLADRLLAIAFLVVTQLEVWVFEADAGHSLALRSAAAVMTLLASGALVFRRSRPAWAFWLNSAGVVGAISVGFPSDFYQWTNLIVSYSIAAHGTSRQAWAALPAATGGVLFYFARFPAEGGWVIAGFATTMWVSGWLAGRVYGARIEEVRLKAERDLTLRIAETHVAQLELEAERARVARELHDIVGHTVNVMVVHAGAGRTALDRDPEAVRRALETIETTGRDALHELDRVLAVLRRDEDTAELAPAPDLADLGALAQTFERAGLATDLSIAGLVEAVPSSVQLAVYRIVQEALTNVLKHSGAQRSRVDVRAEGREIRVTVDDDGVGIDAGAGPGRGISGIRERAAIHDGRVTFRDNAGKGTSMTATLHWETR